MKSIVEDFDWEIRLGSLEQTKHIIIIERYFTSKNIDHVQEDQFIYENKLWESLKN